jgi:lactoylglutathione lyase
LEESSSTFGPPVLFVQDLARSKVFYRDVLGLQPAFEDSTSVGMTLGDHMVLLVTVESGQELLAGQAPGTPLGQRPTNVFNLFVDDVDEWVSRLSAMGAHFLGAPIDRPWGRRTAHLRDPDGFIWELSQSIP